ncbi:MAG: carbohydrate-binding family 9-like protein [Pyrinomonadaceae bacterium]
MTREPSIGALYSELGVTANALDHPEWTRAHPIQITRKWSGADAPASRHAEARIIWTDESLIVRFVCRQEEPLIVNPNPQFSKKTIKLWDRDVCEIFIAPDAQAPERYFEFEVSPLGEWVDLAISFKPAGRETDFEFHSGMTTAATMDGSQMTVAMEIPWSSSLPKPQKGDVWRVNLFRCVGFGDDRYLAWQPTYAPEPNFHVPEVFGWLAFL